MSRPRFHVTAPTGWINDPLGATWHEGPDSGRYELFVQHVPDAPDWRPACSWGQLRSPDLVRWEWAGTALTPGPGEAGCWSGSVAVRDDGVPVIIYTSVLAGQLDVGRIALATGDLGWRHWTADPGPPVLPGPPPTLDVAHFRDPFVWRSGSGWCMAIGGGLSDGRAVALQYSSSDLRHWTFDSVLAERPATETQPLWAGSVWECVQFFPLEERWVLMVSAWHEGSGLRVLCAVGHYDGMRFVPQSWQRFSALNDVPYATTTFPDLAGRRCAISWMRGTGAAGASWAGMLSLPVVLTLDGERVLVWPHPAVDSLRGVRLASLGPTGLTAGPLALGPFEPALDVEVSLLPGAAAVRMVVGSPEVLDLLIEPAVGRVVVSRPGHADECMPLRAAPEGALRLRLILDHGLAELFSGGVAGAVVVAPMVGAAPITVWAPDGRGGIEGLTIFAMEPGPGPA